MTTVREIHENELAELLELYQMLNPDDPVFERDERPHEQFQTMVHDESLATVVVEHDDRLVSSCVLSITPNLTRNARPFAMIENVITHPAHRQHGFGTLCVERAIEIAHQRGCYKIMLLTGSDKEWKHEFYEACGFDKTAKTGFVLEL